MGKAFTIMRKSTWLALGAAFVAGLALFVRGPVGPASVAVIEVDDLLRETATALSSPRAIAPERVALAPTTQAKKILKDALGAAGLVEKVEEGAWQYLLSAPGAARPVRVLVRYRGDHVLAVAIEHSGLAPEPGLVQAIRSRFPGYAVSIIPPSAG